MNLNMNNTKFYFVNFQDLRKGFEEYFPKYKLNYTTNKLKNQSLFKFFIKNSTKVMSKGCKSACENGKTMNCHSY